MSHITRTSIVVVLVLGVAALLPAAAEAGLAVMPDLSGNWSLSASSQLPGENEPCVYQGTGQLQQVGSQVTGQATLMLVSGPPACPDEMMANVDGSLDGLLFGGQLDGGQLLGIMDFTGQVSQDGRMISGDNSVPDGQPFQGATGTWMSERLFATIAIPTLTGVGLALLVVLLLSGGLLILRRRTVA